MLKLSPRYLLESIDSLLESTDMIRKGMMYNVFSHELFIKRAMKGILHIKL